MKRFFYNILAQKFINGLVNKVLLGYDEEKCSTLLEIYSFIPKEKVISLFQQFKCDLHLTVDYLSNFSDEILKKPEKYQNGSRVPNLKSISYEMCELILIEPNEISRQIFQAELMKENVLNNILETQLSLITFESLEEIFEENFEKLQKNARESFGSCPDSMKKPSSDYRYTDWVNFDRKLQVYSPSKNNQNNVQQTRSRVDTSSLVQEKINLLFKLTGDFSHHSDRHFKTYILNSAQQLGQSLVNGIFSNFQTDFESGTSKLIRVDFHGLGRVEAEILCQKLLETINEAFKQGKALKGLTIHFITGKSRENHKPHGIVASIVIRNLRSARLTWGFVNPGCIFVNL